MVNKNNYNILLTNTLADVSTITQKFKSLDLSNEKSFTSLSELISDRLKLDINKQQSLPFSGFIIPDFDKKEKKILNLKKRPSMFANTICKKKQVIKNKSLFAKAFYKKNNYINYFINNLQQQTNIIYFDFSTPSPDDINKINMKESIFYKWNKLK